MHRRRAARRPVARATRLAAGGLAGVLAAGLGLGGCSTPGGPAAGATSAGPAETASTAAPTPAQVLARTRAAVDAATSSHVAGTLDDAGSPVTVDVSGRIDGSSAQGSIGTTDGDLQFVLVGGRTYLRGDERFWTRAGVPATRAAQLASSRRWVQASEAQAQTFTRLANPRQILGDLLDAGTTSSTQQVRATTVAGTSCWSLTDRVGTTESGLDVDRTTFLPVRLVIGEGRSLTFSQWDGVPAPTAPPAAEILSGG